LADHEVPVWQWQSDADPYKEKDEAKWIWQDYPHESCRILEKALRLKQEVADLGDYEVDLKRMLQVNKKDKNRVRRVRKQANNSDQSRFMSELPEPVIVGADDKTMNQAFGTVQHFLDYIMKRTPESYSLYQSLKKLSLDSGAVEFKEIIEEVIGCIQKGAEAREKVIKTRSDPWNQNHISKAEHIVYELRQNSRSLRDFLETVLKIYTMESFVCYWLNELLRTDNWTEINILTPYLVCLIYTFKLPDYTMKYEGGFMNTMLGYLMKQRLYLYRGSTLTPEQFAQYDVAKVTHFSWNCVTSTSRSLDVALDFARQSLMKAEKQNLTKIGVIFVIETDFGSIEDCEGMIDVAKNSKFPHEQEVILAPGTVFELGKIQLNKKNKIYEINLKAKRKFEKVTQNIPLLGALQDQAISKDKAVIEGIPSADSFRLLQLLEGNRLIQGLEIRNSVIEEHVMEMIGKMRASTNLKKQDIKLRDNTIPVSSLSILAHYFSEISLSDVLLLNKITFKNEEAEKVRNHPRIKEVILREEVLEKFQGNGQLDQLWEKIKGEPQIKHLDLPLQNLQTSNEEFHNVLRTIQNFNFTSLEGFRFTSNPKKNSASEETLNYLLGVLQSMPFLQNLALSLKDYDMISDQKLAFLTRESLNIKPLRKVHLDLQNCRYISDEGLVHIEKALESKSLQHLALNFGYCKRISDKGVACLNGLYDSIRQLEYFALDFTLCKEITDYGLISLRDLLESSRGLQYLSLNFGGCHGISDRGLNNLASAIGKLENLRCLSLDFRSCNRVSNIGLRALEIALKNVTSLQHLLLEFWHCRKIDDEGLGHLKNALLASPELKYLSLAFGGCYKISNRGLDHLEIALKSQTSLKELSLEFNRGYGYEERDAKLNSLQERLSSSHQVKISINQRKAEDWNPRPPSRDYLKEELSPLRLVIFIVLFFIFTPIFPGIKLHEWVGAVIGLALILETGICKGAEKLNKIINGFVRDFD